MRRLDNYIIEKLHLRKGVKHCHGELKHFIVVYSSRGEDKFKFFGKYDDAVIFSKKEYYLAGWCLTQEQYEETWDVVCHMTDEPFNTIREDWLKRLVKYAKENNLVDLFKYEKVTEKLHLTKDVKRADPKFTHFVLVYSAKGMYPKKVKNWVKFFDSYNETIEFLESKEYSKRKYVCGYCLTDEEYKKAYKIVYDGETNTGILIQNWKWEEKLRQYAKENNLTELYDYCK